MASLLVSTREFTKTQQFAMNQTIILLIDKLFSLINCGNNKTIFLALAGGMLLYL